MPHVPHAKVAIDKGVQEGGIETAQELPILPSAPATAIKGLREEEEVVPSSPPTSRDRPSPMLAE